MNKLLPFFALWLLAAHACRDSSDHQPHHEDSTTPNSAQNDSRPASETAGLTFSVPPLRGNQPGLESIHLIGDQIIIGIDGSNSGAIESHYPFWRLDERKGDFLPFIDDDENVVVAVSENSSRDLIASLGQSKLHLRFAGHPMTGVSIADKYQGDFLLSANDPFTYLVFSDRIIEISREGTIREINLFDVIERCWRWETLPRHIATTKEELLLGYDEGEWGGRLFAIQIDKDGLTRKSTLLLSDNICAIDQDSKGRIWIASSLAHLAQKQAGLYLSDGKTVSAIISMDNTFSEKGSRGEQAMIGLPGTTQIGGITVNPMGEVIIVASEVGLFSYSLHKPLLALWKGSLAVNDKWSKSYPRGIIRKGNKLYIASTSLGVILFEKKQDGRYVPARQIAMR